MLCYKFDKVLCIAYSPRTIIRTIPDSYESNGSDPRSMKNMIQPRENMSTCFPYFYPFRISGAFFYCKIGSVDE